MATYIKTLENIDGDQVLPRTRTSAVTNSSGQDLDAIFGTYRKASDQDAIDLSMSSDIAIVKGKIPTQASSSNLLADKNFVNSSITTQTATFRGTSAAGLTETLFLNWANSLTKTKNDYVFWNTNDTAGNTLYKKYKYDGTTWLFEYTLNNSSFTAALWSAINSGITSTKVAEISLKLNITDDSLTTTSKTIPGAINELKKASPNTPSANGSYFFHCSVVNGVPTYEWVDSWNVNPLTSSQVKDEGFTIVERGG